MPERTDTTALPSVYEHLGTQASSTSDDEARGSLRVRDDLRQPGGLLAAPLGVLTLDAAAQNVHIHAAASPTRVEVHVFDAASDVGELHVLSRIARRGRGQIYTEARLVDAARPDRTVGYATTTFVVTGPPTGGSYTHPAALERDASPTPLFEALGGRRGADGAFSIRALDERTPRLHSGVMQATAEAAALDLVARQPGELPLRTEYLGTTVLTAGRAGPFAVVPELLAVDDRSAGVRVEIRDDGAGNRPVALITVRIRREPA